MNDPDPNDLWVNVLEWLRIAARDRHAVQLCLSADVPMGDVAAYHCQQAAETILKGFLVRSNTDFRKTHDLEAPGGMAVAVYPEIEELLRPMYAWSGWAIDYRYPGETHHPPAPSAGELTDALALINHLAEMLRALGPPA